MTNFGDIHGIIVHVAVIAIIAGFFLEVLSVYQKKEKFGTYSLILLAVGVLGIVGANITGDTAAESVKTIATLKEAPESHEFMAHIALALCAAACCIRLYARFSKKNNPVLVKTALLIYLLGIIALAVTGFSGGKLAHTIEVEKQNAGTPVPTQIK